MSMSLEQKTAHAPAERYLYDRIEKQHAAVKRSGALLTIMEQMPCAFLVVNDLRQTVFANRHFLALANVGDEKAVLGLRIGEVLECPRSTGSLAGCGTTGHCRGCGITAAVLTALESGTGTGLGEIEQGVSPGEGNFVFQEHAIAFTCEGERFVAVVLLDRGAGRAKSKPEAE